MQAKSSSRNDHFHGAFLLKSSYEYSFDYSKKQNTLHINL